ncbi:MAG: cupin domain-containing protein [Acidobacteria bacterium]|nr:MAG: cupin domain-containing protein [Acidobacteriota bacterium]
MAAKQDSAVSVETTAAKLPEGVLEIDVLKPESQNGCTVFVHYNGPTDQLSGVCTGMAVLDPGASPHPVHQHPEEEFLIIAAGTGEIECGGKTTEVGPGAIMYCAGNTPHGIVNTGKVPLTFYWSKWMAKGF